MLLSELVCNSKLKYSCTNEIDYTKIEIKDITRDTRQVIDGSMFIAVIGVKVDGHDLINEAIEKVQAEQAKITNSMTANAGFGGFGF